MKKICIGDRFEIQCYKHNGKIHRAWDEAVVLDIKKDYIVFGNNRTKVTEAQGTFWKTKEPAVMYFFKNEWFNIISQMNKAIDNDDALNGFLPIYSFSMIIFFVRSDTVTFFRNYVWFGLTLYFLFRYLVSRKMNLSK